MASEAGDATELILSSRWLVVFRPHTSCQFCHSPWLFSRLHLYIKRFCSFRPSCREFTLKRRMRLVQPHRLKTRTCLTKPMRTTTKSSAPLNQQRRSRSSEQRKLPGGLSERLADVFMDYDFCTGHGGFTDVLGPLGIGWCCDVKSWDTDFPSPENVFSHHLITNLLEVVLGKWTQSVFVSQKDVSHTCSHYLSWSILKKCEFSTCMKSNICFYSSHLLQVWIDF